MAKQTFTTGQVLTAAQVNSLQANDFNQTVSVKTANYTLAAADKGTRIEFNTSGSVTCTVNSGLFDAGDTLIIQNRGAGVVTVTAGTATVDTSATLALKQYDAGTLYFISDSASIFFNTDAADGGSPLTTKGDIFTYSTSDARLGVGNDGETIVANSAAATGLSYKEDYAAGKNKVINGDFRINQRAFSSGSVPTISGTYTLDRWKVFGALNTGTTTFSVQTFTPGTAPVTGYESINFFRALSSGTASANSASYSQFTQFIEDVRTFANQTVTISFWAKAASGTPKVAVEITQSFGSGGSPSSGVNTYAGQVTLSTSWTRYSVTVAVPSISGKTIGTTANTSSLIITFWNTAGSDFNARTGTLGLQDNTFDFWGVQVEAGSVATAFQTATGTLQGELAACQRYFQKSFGIATTPGDNVASLGMVYYTRQASSGNTEPSAFVRLAPNMRTAPSVTLYNPYTATAGQWSDGSTNSANARAFNAVESSFIIDNTDVAINVQAAGIQYAASAEL